MTLLRGAKPLLVKTSIMMSLFLALASLSACNNKGASSETQASVEKLDDIKPVLPEVPTLPPPPYPMRYSDQAYSIYGLRKSARSVIDKEVTVRGYITKIYEAPACSGKPGCEKTLSPHAWMADSPSEPQEKWIKITDYADNQADVDKAIAQARAGNYKPPPAETGLAPIPTDFAVGNQVSVRGRFTYVSSRGFNDSAGLLEYLGHQTMQKAP